MRSDENELWRFETANLAVVLTVEPEDSDPVDHFDYDEDVELARTGDSNWFQAKVSVWTLDDGGELECKLGSDYLGTCSYYRYRDFYAGHRDPDPMARNCSIMRAVPGNERTVICNYFPSMVREAIGEARTELRRLRSIPVRSAA